MVKQPPGHVKRPPNAFLVFAASQRKEVNSQTPEAHQSEVSKDCAAIWNEMSAEQKAPYFWEAKRLAIQHKIDHPDYVYRPRQKKKKNAEGETKKSKTPKRSVPDQMHQLPTSSESVPKPSDWMSLQNPMSSGVINNSSGFYNGYYPTGSTVQMNPIAFLPPNMPNNCFIPPTDQVSYPYHQPDHHLPSTHLPLQNRSQSTASSASTSSSGASTSSDPSESFDDFQSINPSICQLSDAAWQDYLNNF